MKGASITKCKKCNEPVLPLTLCENCGTYKERELIDVLKKLTKKEKKQREKEIKEKEKEESKKKPLELSDLSKK